MMIYIISQQTEIILPCSQSHKNSYLTVTISRHNFLNYFHSQTNQLYTFFKTVILLETTFCFFFFK